LPVSLRKVLCSFSIVLVCLPAPAAEPHRPSVVRLDKTDAGFQLIRNGTPYFIKGAGGDGERKALAAAGGNSIRTWGVDNLGPLLDEADRLGLTVTVGIWLGHERHGFNYNNADQVAEQYERARQAIVRYKAHPAVLMWALGNEMEGYGNGDNAAIWSAVNNLAGLAKKLDPNHPTMTVLAEIGGDKVKNVHRLCPDIDVVGINSYGGVASLPERYRKAGGVKPYVVTEFGPPGVWETKKTDWGAVPELTSTEKAGYYRSAYQQGILGAKGLCLGGYAFAWGHKQEATATWFGLFLPDGSRFGGVDALTEAWSGKPPANRCPVIDNLKLAGPDQVEPGATVRATLTASDPDGDPLKVRWVLSREADAYGEGGDAETAPPTYPEAILKADARQAEVRLPKDGGGYRLFAYVHDDHGGAAVANVPLRVKGPVVLPNGKAAKLPLVVYDEAGRENPPYIPSGWMGNNKAVTLKEDCEDNPHTGKTCIRVDYRDKDGWAGVVWQHPQGDWGERAGGWDLTGAKQLTFWARGDQGGEVVSFEFGLIGKDKRFPDTAKGKLADVKLTARWQRYSIDLAGKDLTRIKTGFCWVVGGSGQPMTFYLDDIRYE
jgi:hypothetical protein